MARKGTATVKAANKNDKYIFLDSDDEEVTPSGTASEYSRDSSPLKRQNSKKKRETIKSSPKVAREQLNLSKPPKLDRRQPRQATVPTAVEPKNTLASELFPVTELFPPTETHEEFLVPQDTGRQKEKKSKRRIKRKAPAAKEIAETEPNNQASKVDSKASSQLIVPQVQYQDLPYTEEPDNMIQGGASIPTNQQRNMRACMVCSIVRTQQQFMTSGCPNCEDILELAGNSEQINDCTSQVFEGLISVSDTKRSWVARYQRLEGYVPGVYATQVEGILPEDVLVAVENAGINYVPRDGSEQEMLPKD